LASACAGDRAFGDTLVTCFESAAAEPLREPMGRWGATLRNL
jgi:hypothetical protein